MYHVVFFLKENSVGVIPRSWIARMFGSQKGLCHWPSGIGKQGILDKMIEDGQAPGSDWTLCEIQIKYSTGNLIYLSYGFLLNVCFDF